MLLTPEEIDRLYEFVDHIFDGDEQAQEILNRSGLTKDQLRILNVVTINAIRAYDSLKEQSK